jgi:ABC-type uncharacterized transport system involved in gliding motility auxiliary subunit
MNKRSLAWIYSVGGVLAVAAALVALNFIVGAVPARVDLTDGKLYTLSDATRRILGSLEVPVRIRFYATQGDENVPVPTRAFASRVEDLLREFRAASNGRITIEKLNPRPDSDAEDAAGVDGIEAQVAPSGEKFYLGLSVGAADQKVAIPVLAQERERLLEYDLVRAITRVARAEKPVVGILSSLPVFGMPMNPMMGMQGSEPQIFVSELQRDFDVKRVSGDVDRIDDDIRTLLLIHPRGLSEQTEFALDQFVLRGGKLVVFLDPYAYFDQGGPMQGMGGSSSNLPRLLKAWGLEYDPDKVVLDMKYMAGSGPRAVPTVIQLDSDALNRDDVTTSYLGTVLLAFAGTFGGKPAEGLTQSVLMRTSQLAGLVPNADAMRRGEEALRGFKPDDAERPIALRLTGRFKTAFPDGRPAGKGEEGKPAAPSAEGPAALKESKEENSVVLVGDTDMLNDGAAVQIREMFGQRIAIPINGNLAFVQALVEQMAGDPQLINLRGRASAARPFTVVKEIEARAAQAYLGKIKELEDSLDDTRKRLESLQKTRAPGAAASAILSPEQQAEVDGFRKRAAETRRELKEVRRQLRAETEALEFWTKVVNIAAMPVLVALAGLLIALVRRRRRAAH